MKKRNSMDYSSYIYVAAAAVGVAGAFGAFYAAFRNGRVNGLVDIQQKTIVALQQQVELMRSRIVDLEKENSRQGMIQDTIISALKQKGMIVTIEGEMITFESDGKSSIVRQKPPTALKLPTTKTTRATIVKKEITEEGDNIV